MQTILYNGEIYQNRDQFVQALVVEDGWIVFAGTSADAQAFASVQAEQIDLQGRTVVPGFQDSHLHFFWTAEFQDTLDLYGATSIAESKERARQFLEANPHSTVLWGRGWNQDYFTDECRLLNRFDLDAISTEIPIILTRACGHVAACNTLALQVCGITAQTSQPAGGHFDVDEAGIPLGILRENALEFTSGLKPSITAAHVAQQLTKISALANAQGITSVHTNDLTIGAPDSTEIEQGYVAYSQAEPTVRIYHQVSFASMEEFALRVSQGYHNNETPFHRYGPLKLFADGSLGARTASLRNPYQDDPATAGMLCLNAQQLEEFVRFASEHEIQVAIHAIGDGAIELVLDTYAKTNSSDNPLRHGIIHCQITDLPLLKRFQAQQILAYVQPIFLHYDLHIVEDRVGKELASTSYAFHTMEELGLHIAYGSDAPVEPFHVMNNLHCAVNRQDLQEYPQGGFHPQECVDIASAVDYYTIGSSYASFEETKKGRLLPGFAADLAVLSQPIFTIPSSLIRHTEVELTMVDGRVVYQRDPQSTN